VAVPAATIPAYTRYLLITHTGTGATPLDPGPSNADATITMPDIAGAGGKVFLQNTEIPIDELVPKLKAIAEARGNANGGSDERIYVRGDKKVDYGTMSAVLGRLSGAGFHRVALVTEFEQGGAGK